jgi:hypothetical protein
VPQLLGGHPSAGVDYRQLARPAVRRVEPQPVKVPHHAAVGTLAERRNRVKAIDSQLAKAL